MNQHYPTWAQHPLMKDYYDHYWGRPVYGENELFEWLCLEIFQAGLAWRQVWQRRAAFEAAFANFEIEAVAAFTAADVDRLQNDSGIIRNRAKIQACCHNAQLLAQWHQAGRYLSPVAWVGGYRRGGVAIAAGSGWLLASYDAACDDLCEAIKGPRFSTDRA